MSPFQAVTPSSDLQTANPLAIASGMESTSPFSLPSGQRASVLFIDAGVENIQTLIEGAQARTEVHLLQPGQDAIAQITNTLLGRSGIESLQIVSHGRSGGLRLGESWLDVQSLPGYVGQLKSWGAALSENADLLLYGCNVGQDAIGRGFVELLAETTGADVAASDNLTGSAALGGDWDLEVTTGAIESTLVLDAAMQQRYQGRLDNALFAQALQFTSGNVGTDSKTTVDTFGNRYTVGIFSGTVDFDPGTGANTLTGLGLSDIFISKLDINGNVLWVKQIGSTDNESVNSVAIDGSGNVYITGNFSGTVDFDPGTGTSNLTSTGLQDGFISKLDSSGNYLWAKRIGGTNPASGRSVTIDGSGNVYTTGTFAGTVDFDPGAGTSNLTSTGGYDIFISKLDNSGNYLWAKQFGGPNSDIVSSVAVDGSGNVYTTGEFEGTIDFDPGAGTSNLTSAGVQDVFINKLDSNGNYLWAKRFGSTNIDRANGVAIDGSGNVYTTGSFNGTVDFDPNASTNTLTSAGLSDIFISKLDSNGNYLWAKQLGGISTDFASSITLDSSGNVYTTGAFWGTADFDPGVGTNNFTSAGNTDIVISKLDSSGNYLWAKQFGGINYDIANSVTIDGSGNVYTTGYFMGSVDFDPGTGTNNLTTGDTTNLFLSKLTAAGNFAQALQVTGGSMGPSNSRTSVDALGNRYTVGSFSGTVDFDPGAGTSNLISAGNNDIFISKLDSSGNYLWAKQLGGINSDLANSVTIDASGNVYTTGFFSGTVDFDPGAGTSNLISAGSTDIFISKLDSSGNYLWAKQLGGTSTELAQSITIDASGNVYTTGSFNGTADFDPGASTNNLTSVGSADIFISKLDSSGNYLWAKQLGGSNNEVAQSMTLDGSGNVYTTGYFQGTADFDPGAGVNNLTSAGVQDIFISKLDSNGNYLWANRLGGASNDAAYSMTLDGSGNVYTTGIFTGTVDFDPGAGTNNLTSAGGSQDIFISKLDSSGNYLWAKQLGGTMFDATNSMVIDGSGNVYTTGYFQGTADFDPGAGTNNLTSRGSADIFISKLDSNGNYLWAKQLGSTNYDSAHSVAIDGSGNVYTTGYFNGTVDFDPGAGITNLATGDTTNMFLSKLSQIQPSIAPVITLPTGAIAYTENATAIVLDAAATVADTDSANFDTGTLTVSYTAGGTTDDRLAIRNEGNGANQINITGANAFYGPTQIGTFTGSSGTTNLVITLNAAADPTSTQALLRNITYSNVSENPSTTDRTVAFSLTDGDGGTSTTVIKTVQVTAVNDVPTITNPVSLSVSEDQSTVFAFNTFRIQDIDTLSSTNNTAILSVTNGKLNLTPGSATITSGALGSNTITLTGSLVAIQAAINTLSYTSNTDYNGSENLSITFNDSGNTGPGGANSITKITPIIVNAANDAPIATGTAASTAVLEDNTNPAGSNIGTLLASNYNDSKDTVTGGTTATAIAGIAVTANAATAAQGVWQHFNGTTWIAIPTTGLSDTTAFVITASNNLRFLPAANFNGTPGALTVRLSDGTGFVVGSSQNVGTGGGFSGWSAATVTIGTSITAVNDAPTFSAGLNQTIAAGSGAQSIANWATFNPGGGPDEAAQTATYQIIGNSNPSLFTVAPTIATNGTLSYTPGATPGTATLQVRVKDSGLTANGGIDTSATQSFTITVNPPTVSLTATDGRASEVAGDTGTYRISRDQSSGAQTIALTISGTVTAADYAFSSPTANVTLNVVGNTLNVTLADGVGSADIVIAPVDDIQAEADETVQLAISTNPAYTIGTANTATVTIAQNDFVVVNTNSSGEGSLRQAILNANAIAGTDTITFSLPAGIQTINTSFLPVLTQNVNIRNTTGAENLVIRNTNTASTSLEVQAGVTASFEQFTISNTLYGIQNYGIISSIKDLIITGAIGVALDNRNANSRINQIDGLQLIDNSSNSVTNDGVIGTILNMRIHNNVYAIAGLSNFSTGRIDRIFNSTISGNAGIGARNFGTIGILVNTTISGNSLGFQNTNTGTTTAIVNVTVAGSTVQALENQGTITTIANSLFVGSGTTSISGGTITNRVNNLSGTFAAVGLSATLASNGGKTQTHALLNNSAAINAGNIALLPTDTNDLDGDGNTTEVLSVDQRGIGFDRQIGSQVDIGAFEFPIVNVAPTIAGTPLTTIAEDSPYSFSPTAADVDTGAVLTFAIANKPTWATFDTNTGALTGTPTNGDVGTTNGIIISVSDGTATTALSAFDLNVTNTNDAPTIAGTPLTTIAEDSPYSFIPTAADVDAGTTLTFSIANKPVWAAFDTNTGALTGTPTNSDVGTTIGIIISVSDGTATTALSAFDLNITNTNDAPTITGTPLTTIAEDSVYSFIPTAADVDAGTTLTFSIVNEPAWATFDTNTGALTGTPTNSDVGTTAGIIISVSDGTATTALSAFDLNVTNTNDAPTITGTPLTTIAEDSPYSFIPTTADVDAGAVLTFSIANKPTWATFNTTTGELAGTPVNGDVGSTNGIIISVTDGIATTALSAFNLNVTNANDAPTITGTPLTTIAEDSLYSFIPTAADVDAGTTLTFSIANKPTWATFNPTTGELTGTPINSNVGTTTGIIISVTDGTATTALSAFDLNVTNVNDAPTALTIANPITTIAENTDTTNPIKIADLIITDIDGGNNTLTLTGADADRFEILGTELYLKSGQPLNFEIKPTYDIGISATDPTIAPPFALTQQLTLTLTNQNDPTIGFLSLSGNPQLGNTLSLNNFLTDEDGITLTSYQWQQSIDGQTWLDIPNNTNSTFTLTSNQIGQQIRVKATSLDALNNTSTDFSPGTLSINGIQIPNNTLTTIAGISTQTLNNWITDLTQPGYPAGLTYVVTVDRPDLFETPPTITPTGKLTYTPKAYVNQNATINLKIEVKRPDSTTDNGLTQSATLKFKFKPEALIRNSSTDELALLYIDKTTQLQAERKLTYNNQTLKLGKEWAIADTADFNRDGIADILIQNQSGDEVRMIMMGTEGRVTRIESLVKDGQILRSQNPNWKIVGFADIDRDNTLDLVWHNQATDEIGFWFMNNDGKTVNSYDYLRDNSSTILKTKNAWQMKAVGDFDGDGDADLLFRLPELNQTAVIRLQGKALVDYQYITSNTDPILEIRGIGDTTGDRTPDIYWQNPTTQQIQIQTLSFQNNSWSSNSFKSIAANAPLQGIGDLDLNNIADLLLREPGNRLGVAIVTPTTITAAGDLKTNGINFAFDSADWQLSLLDEFGDVTV
jgi:hypothetical protein